MTSYSKEGSFVDLYIDINKALNTAKLVKRAVQVRGKGGKVFTRMQWINPEDASSGHGVRKINNEDEMQEAKRHGIFTHPDYKQALEEQGVPHSKKDREEHHFPFYLPETEDTKKLATDAKLSNHMPHGSKDSTQEHELPKDMEREHTVHPEIRSVIEDSITSVDDDMVISDKLQEIRKRLGMNASIIKSHVANHIDETADDNFVRRVQHGALNDGNMELSLLHPQIAKEVINKILGEKLADKFRKDLDKGNLSINFPTNKKEDIQRDGYIASTMEGYVKSNMGEKGLESLQEILDTPFDSTDDMLDEIASLGGENWYDVYERAHAEWKAIGLAPEDRKPTYIAYNPKNDTSGATTYYGNSWLKVTDVDNVLKHCTATMDDSFMTSRSVAKVYNMDHLKDMYIMKCIERHPGMESILAYGENDDAYGGWNWYDGDIPIELQYHQPKLDPSQFKVMSLMEALKDSGELDDLDIGNDDVEIEDEVDNDSGEDFKDIEDDLEWLDDLDFDDDNLDWDDILEDGEHK